MRIANYKSKIGAFLAIAVVAFFVNASQACDIYFLECIYSDGRFEPYEARFSTQTSAGGIDINVQISQRLETNWPDSGWEFKTKVSGFVYGLYGSITDSSEFTILADNSYRSKSFARRAKVYGMFPVSPTSFKQEFKWDNLGNGSVKSKYRGDWYRYAIDASILNQAILPLQLRMDLLKEGPDLGTIAYKATSKKQVDDDFMFRFVKEAEVQTPLGKVSTVVYELLKGQHKARMHTVEAGHDLGQMEALVDELIALKKSSPGKKRQAQMEAAREQLNTLLNVDRESIVSISDDEAKSSSGKRGRHKGKGKDVSLVDKASEIEEGNARVFLWLSTKHAYLPVKLLAVIDGNSWSKSVIESVELKGVELPFL